MKAIGPVSPVIKHVASEDKETWGKKIPALSPLVTGKINEMLRTLYTHI